MAVHVPLQTQVYLLVAFGLAVALLIAYRSEVADDNAAELAYQQCQERQRQAIEVNKTRENVGHLIIAMVPDAPQEAKDAMLDGMTTDQLITIENCDRWRG
jgi:hypothetical protein